MVTKPTRINDTTDWSEKHSSLHNQYLHAYIFTCTRSYARMYYPLILGFGFLCIQTLWLKSKKLDWDCPFTDWLLVEDGGMWSCWCWEPKWCKVWGWEENCGVKPLLKLFPWTAGICPVAILSLCTSSLNASFRAVGDREKRVLVRVTSSLMIISQIQQMLLFYF